MIPQKKLEDNPLKAAYNCCELVWAAYIHGSNGDIIIDKNDDGWNWRYERAVNNNEIAADPLVVKITISRFKLKKILTLFFINSF